MGVVGMIVFAKMSNSCCRAQILVSSIGIGGLKGDGFANTLAMSCDVTISWSADDGIGIAKLEGNKDMVSVIHSNLVALIHTL